MAGVHLLSRVETGHSPDWPAAGYAGLVASLLFLVLEIAFFALFTGASPWIPLRMIAAIVLGTGVLPPPATFDLGLAVLALLIHFVLGLTYAVLLAYLVFRLDTMAAVVSGALLGLVLYWVNFHEFTVAFPWFEQLRGAVTIGAHLAYGASAAWVYKGLAGSHVNGGRKAA